MPNPAFRFADIILPLALPKPYTYAVPSHLADEVCEGKRVVVQLGKKKYYTGIIYSLHNNKPTGYETKEIFSVLDETPVILPAQLEFWQWLASYYLCSLGEIYKAAVPSGLKLESETKILYNPEFKEFDLLSDKEEVVIQVLEKKNFMSVQDVNSLIDVKNSLPVVKSLIDKGAITVEEKLKEKYKPKYETYTRLNKDLSNEEKLHELFDRLERAPKQLALLMSYISLAKFLTRNPQDVKRQELLNSIDASPQTFHSLVEKEVFETYEVEIGRLDGKLPAITKPNPLNPLQQNAFYDIKKTFAFHDVTLLNGVTSSGKTELYIHLLKEYVEKGKQVLYLLPEIALTTQIINRLRQVFGNNVGVYHSKFSDSERVEIWRNLQAPGLPAPCPDLLPLTGSKTPSTFAATPYQVILGVRSSVFLPFKNLGLIIVDEEHENTYKQHDPAPRYNARDAAIVLAKLHGAKVLLGTATPSFESFYNAQSGKFGYVELSKRYLDIKMPEIIVADVKDARRKKLMKSHFSPILLDNIKETLDNKQQVILFQNRRGFSPFLACELCGWVPKCKHCDVSLTYHKSLDQLQCHYCGYSIHNQAHCSACTGTAMQTMGFGTEKIEDEMAIFFPSARIARMDLDTTRSRKSYERIISDFESGNVDLLIGTQMVSKGLDFDNVSLVGILDADNMLNFPDFRAFERSFQLMAQVSGRAGRKNKRGKVIIQTTNPQHHVIIDVTNNDFFHTYNEQLPDRQKFGYPPFFRLIRVTLKHKNQKALDKSALVLAKNLKSIFGQRVIGPEYPLVDRIRDQYLKNILLKIEKDKSGARAKELLLEAIDRIRILPEYKALIVNIDVDPQ